MKNLIAKKFCCACASRAGLATPPYIFLDPPLQSNIALEEVLTDLRRIVTNAPTNEQEQTIGNLAMVAAAFERLAQLIDEGTVIPNTVSLLLTNMSMYSNGLSPASLFSNFPVSDSAGPDQHIGQLATMG